MVVQLQHVSVACSNSNANSISVAKMNRDILAYAGGNFVAIYDTHRNFVLRTLQHQAMVTAVYWLENVFISGDVDGVLFVWDAENWVKKMIIHEGCIAVTAISAVMRGQDLILVVAYGDGGVVMYENEKVIEKVDLGCGAILECLAMVEVDEHIMIAGGGVSMNVHLIVMDRDGKNLKIVDGIVGHTGWIMSMDMVRCDEKVLLATGSQDGKIRVWEIASDEETVQNAKATFKMSHLYGITNSAILSGHVDWVCCVNWKPKSMIPTLLTASMDHAMLIWSGTKSSNLERYQFEIAAKVGDVSYDGVGFKCCRYVGKQNDILALGLHGEFSKWTWKDDKYVPQPTVGGHFAPVVDLAWDPNQKYIVSASLDQTTRLTAPYISTEINSKSGWQEISIPQIHGFNMSCVCFVNNQEHVYVSGSDEKILRVFGAPQTVVDMLEQHCEYQSSIIQQQNPERPQNAFTPELSLTNKAKDNDSNKTNIALMQFPPIAKDIRTKTMWPELHKLYGHGNELLCVCSTTSGKYIASACRARNEATSAIWFWDTKTWMPSSLKLTGHASSVANMTFSSNDKWLASVSKDRHLCLYAMCYENGIDGKLIQRIKAHKRIIWSVSYSHDAKLLATGSRDQFVKIWEFCDNENQWVENHTLPEFAAAVTAVAFAPYSDTPYLLAIGLESGEIHLFQYKTSNWHFYDAVQIDDGHVKSVRKICWNSIRRVFASCSDDFSLRIFGINTEEEK